MERDTVMTGFHKLVLLWMEVKGWLARWVNVPTAEPALHFRNAPDERAKAMIWLTERLLNPHARRVHEQYLTDVAAPNAGPPRPGITASRWEAIAIAGLEELPDEELVQALLDPAFAETMLALLDDLLPDWWLDCLAERGQQMNLVAAQLTATIRPSTTNEHHEIARPRRPQPNASATSPHRISRISINHLKLRRTSVVATTAFPKDCELRFANGLGQQAERHLAQQAYGNPTAAILLNVVQQRRPDASLQMALRVGPNPPTADIHVTVVCPDGTKVPVTVAKGTSQSPWQNIPLVEMLSFKDDYMWVVNGQETSLILGDDLFLSPLETANANNV